MKCQIDITSFPLPLSVVANAMYTFHSFNIPDPQEDFSLNQCWNSHSGDLVLDMWCNVFIARIPSFSPKAGTPSHTVSFESACFPGYFVRQKNFRFILQKRDGSDVFGEFLNSMYTLSYFS